VIIAIVFIQKFLVSSLIELGSKSKEVPWYEDNALDIQQKQFP